MAQPAIEELGLDIEVYRNYLLVKFMHAERGTIREYECYPGHPLHCGEIRQIMAGYRTITFNGRRYDLPIVALALSRAEQMSPEALCDLLKNASDAIITGGLQPWDFDREFDVQVPAFWDSVDLIEVAPGKASLKLYGGRMHAPKLQDLPVEHTALIEPYQRTTLRLYCGNDLSTTILLRNKLAPQIALRTEMSAQYGQDLRSKSDAQIAEAVIRAQVGERMGAKVTRPVVEPGTTFRYDTPSFIRFRTPVLQALLREVEAAQFEVKPTGKVDLPKFLKDAKIAVGGSVYRMGIGGLHSSEQSVAHFTDDDHILVDRDVASYYPAIILNCELYPHHMGRHFLDVYRDIVDRRLACKRAGDKVGADTLKIVINGSFGKLGSKWSVLYSPKLLIQVTLTGQLALLMFIEMLETSGIPVVSANTDGIVMKCPRRLVGNMEAVVAAWEAITRFETEATYYHALYSRDINNYLAIKPDGKHKGKGAYADAGLQKNPNATILAAAVVAYLRDGTPVETTIRASQDITQFTFLRTVKGGGLWDLAYLGKVCRWYRSTASQCHIEYVTNGNKVPLSDNAMPLMDLPFAFPTDVDFDWYINEAREILMDIGETPRPPKLTAKRKKELAAAAAALEERELEDA